MLGRKHVVVGAATVLACLWGAAPSLAAGEAFQVQSVKTTGCASSVYTMNMLKTNFDGGLYGVRTMATVDGLVYMNESATAGGNGPATWSLFNLFSYGAVPNPGTWPIPPARPLRVDITLERPLGTVLYAWTLVTAGCDSATILYNGLTSLDADKDLLPFPADRCPTVAATTANGCPVLERTLTIAYERAAHRFFGWLVAEGHPKLYAGRKVLIWKVRPGPDKLVGRTWTTKRGNWILVHSRVRGVYYATTGALLLPVSGLAKAEKSLTLRLR